MKKSISMTDFVLEQNKETRPAHETLKLINNYANFLKQPLELWMFIPCDLIEGRLVVLSKIDNYYKQAKNRCLFESFYEKDILLEFFKNEEIEDMIKFNLTLTKTAIKQIGL